MAEPVGGVWKGFRHSRPRVKSDGTWTVVSPVQPADWVPHTVGPPDNQQLTHVTAFCRNGRRAAHMKNKDNCGIYARFKEGDIVAGYGKDNWMTRVDQFGQFTEADLGVRSEYARITGIRIPHCSHPGCTEEATSSFFQPDEDMPGAQIYHSAACDKHHDDVLRALPEEQVDPDKYPCPGCGHVPGWGGWKYANEDTGWRGDAPNEPWKGRHVACPKCDALIDNDDPPLPPQKTPEVSTMDTAVGLAKTYGVPIIGADDEWPEHKEKVGAVGRGA